MGFVGGLVVKKIRLPIQEMLVQSLDQEDPLEKGLVTHSSTLPGKSQGQRNLASCSPRGSHRVGVDLVTKLQQSI